MIQSHEDFEIALEEAAGLLADHPAEGTPSQERLLSLMRDIAAYRPAIIVKEDEPASESERLSQRLAEFQKSLPRHLSTHWHSMIGGDLRSAQ